MNIPNFWTIRDYLHAVGHYKWRAMAFFAVTMLVATLYLCFAPRQYASEAKLFVRVARENAALDPTLTRGETMAVTSSSREEEMNSIVEHLRCRYILERTLAKLDPDAANTDPEAREEALIALGDSLYVASPRSSTVVAVQGRARSAERAQKIVAAAVDVYMEEHMRISRSQTSYQFFTDQSKHLDDQLETAQGALRDGKNKAGIGSIEDRRSAVEGQINAVEVQIPFLQRVLNGSFQLLPIMMRDQSPHVAQILGKVLAQTLAGHAFLLVASTDLSHFYTQQQANLLDAAMLEQIAAFSPEGLFEVESQGKGFACGLAPLATVLWAARGLGANRVQVLHHATSGDVTGDFSSVVGYGAAIIVKE